MFLPNATLLSIVDLNYDCLFHIFSQLRLSDLLNLRLQCSTLSDAVNKFLPHLGTLSIVYTEDHALTEAGSDGLSSFRCYHERGLSIVEENYREAEYSKSFNYWIDKTCKDIYRSRFRREDFMIISGRQKYEMFLQFFKKYDIRAIKTLAVFIDPECRCKIDYPMLSAVCMLLELCPKVESLFLERTYRVYCDSELEEPKQLGSFINSISRVETDCLSLTIAKLSSLNELHYFALRNSRVACLIIPNSWLSLGVQNNNLESFGHFLSTMFKKLGVFSYRIEAGGSHLKEIRGQTIGNILELCLKDGDFEQLMKSGTKFPNLRSLTLTGGLQNFGRLNIGNSLEQLTSLQFCKHLYLTREIMQNLNALPNLKQLTAESIEVANYDSIWVEPRDGNNGLVPEVVNHTIEHIEVEKAYNWRLKQSSDSSSCRDHYWDYDCRLYDFIALFPSLLTATISLPEPVSYNRNNFMDFKITRGFY